MCVDIISAVLTSKFVIYNIMTVKYCNGMKNKFEGLSLLGWYSLWTGKYFDSPRRDGLALKILRNVSNHVPKDTAPRCRRIEFSEPEKFQEILSSS
jgi:hypothetical protein